MPANACVNCGTNESKKWIKANDQLFCSKKCQDASGKKGEDAACEFC